MASGAAATPIISQEKLPQPTAAASTPMMAPHLRDVRAHVYRIPGRVEKSFVAAAQGPSLVNFWATWCEPCLKEMPRLVELHNRFGRAVHFLGVAHQLNTPQNALDVLEVAGAAHINWPQYLESERDAVQAKLFDHGASGMPAFALFDRSGAIRLMFVGTLDIPENYDRLVAALVRIESEGHSQAVTERKIR